MLLLAAGRVVSVDGLAEGVWNDEPPATARTQVAICIAGLRKVFRTATGGDEVLVTASPGYLLRIGSHRLDALHFAGRLAEANAAATQGNLVEAVELTNRALCLWSGVALAGVSGHQIEVEAARLEEERLAAEERRITLRLELGEHQLLIGELTGLVQEHPLREQGRAQLMLAQYRAGRRAEAMETYREGRRVSIAEFGLEPGPVLQDLHAAILRDAPELAGDRATVAVVPAPPTPAELPSNVSIFVGRAAELCALDDLLTPGQGDHPVAVGLVTGGVGVGKTALALRWSHRAAARFPDGQLFGDLHGYEESGEPTDPGALLQRFLRALGVPVEDVPPGLAGRTALYRSLLSGRRLLVVLDNVRDVDQVRPLLPGSGGCCVLVTSRDRMSGLLQDFGGVHIRLNRLGSGEAVELLSKFVGDTRSLADPASLEELGELCDGLPLALRTAAARLATKPHWTVRNLVDRLACPGRRLDELTIGAHGVRGRVRSSYDLLSGAAAGMYRRLGLVDRGEFGADTGAELLGISPLDAECLIEDLVDHHLVEVAGGHDSATSYQIRPLLKLHALERALEEDGPITCREISARFNSVYA